jgi:predicted enzyme related to lactoylglutathione lyase
MDGKPAWYGALSPQAETNRGIEVFNPRISLPKFAVPGKCWQGYFQDPGGNTFGVFEVDERAGR